MACVSDQSGSRSKTPVQGVSYSTGAGSKAEDRDSASGLVH